MQTVDPRAANGFVSRFLAALVAAALGLTWVTLHNASQLGVGAYPAVALHAEEVWPLRFYLVASAVWVALLSGAVWAGVAEAFHQGRWAVGALALCAVNALLSLPLLAGDGAWIEYYRWPAFGASVAATLVVSYWLSRVLGERRYASTVNIDRVLAHPLLVGVVSTGVFVVGIGALGKVLHLGWLYPALLLLIAFWITGAGMLALRGFLGRGSRSQLWSLGFLLLLGGMAPLYLSHADSFVRIRMLVQHHRPGLSRLLTPTTTVRAEGYKVIGKFWPRPELTRAVPLSAFQHPDVLEKRPHVVFFVIDALRRDMVGAYGAKDGVTPNLDRLARGGTSYRNAYSPSAGTGLSVGSIFAGMPPAALMGADAAPLFLPQALRALGYGTSSTARAHELRLFRYPALINAGIDELGFDVVNAAPGPGKLVQDAHHVDGLISRLRDATEPRFEYVHLMAAHGPFAAETAAREYREAVRTADAQLGRLLDFMDATDSWSNTMLYVFGDHGEGLGEHGMFAHSQALYEEQVAVPLITRVPTGSPGFIEDVMSLYDLPQLVVEELGLQWPFSIAKRCQFQKVGAAQGVGIQELFIGETLVWRALRAGGYAIHRRYLEDRDELYDLRTDPLELVNIGGSADSFSAFSELIRCVEQEEAELRQRVEKAAVERRIK